MEDFFQEFDKFSQSWWPYVVSLFITVISAIRLYAGGTKCPSTDNVEKKNIIITGASGGLGLELAIQLAKRGGNIILTTRSAEKGRKALEHVKKTVPGANVIVKLLDVSEFSSIREFVNQVEAEYDKIDILINNAGVMLHPHKRTSEGNEITIATNYFGPFLLTHLLLHLLNKSENGRVINVSAQAHYNGKINLDNLNCEQKYDEREVFPQSKLALTIFTKQMASLCKKSKITFNSANPGLVRGTQHMQNSSLQSSALTKFAVLPWVWLFMKTPMQGIQTVLYLAVDKSLRNVSGCYFSDCEIKEPSDVVYDTTLSDLLYEKSCKYVNINKDKIFAKAFGDDEQVKDKDESEQ